MSHRSWYRQMVPLALAAGLYVPAIAAQGIQPHIPITTTLNEITAARTGYVAAFNAKDAKALSGLYTASGVAIGMDGSETSGAPAIRTLFADSAASWPHAVIASTSVNVFGSLAVDIGTWTVHPKAGGEMVNQYLIVWRHDMRGWKVQNSAIVPKGN